MSALSFNKKLFCVLAVLTMLWRVIHALPNYRTEEAIKHNEAIAKI